MIRSARLIGPLILASMVPAARVAAQTFEGRVVDERDERPVSGALVRLVDDEGVGRGVAIAGADGFYRLAVPAPGTYRLEAARLGFHNFETPLLEASTDGVYRIDLLLSAAPVELPGFTVETNRVSDDVADQSIRLMTGLSPASLRYAPIRASEIQRHIEMGRNLEGALRWSHASSLIVSYTTEGPCFSARARGCLPVYLNGLQLNRDFMVDLPLDMVSTIVVLTPGETIVYPAGAILLYTDAWLR